MLAGMIFDFDGTLADTVPICIVAVQDTLHDMLGKRYSEQQILAMFGPSEEGVFQNMLGERWQEGMTRFLRAYEAHHARCDAPFPGVYDLLEQLTGRGVRLAVVTGKGPQSASLSIRRLGLDRFFDHVAVGSAEGLVKSRQIREITADWNMTPEQVAYVGDSISDVHHAQEAGVVSVAVSWAASADATALHASHPQYLFRSVAQFSTWCDGQTRV